MGTAVAPPANMRVVGTTRTDKYRQIFQRPGNIEYLYKLFNRINTGQIFFKCAGPAGAPTHRQSS